MWKNDHEGGGGGGVGVLSICCLLCELISVCEYIINSKVGTRHYLSNLYLNSPLYLYPSSGQFNMPMQMPPQQQGAPQGPHPGMGPLPPPQVPGIRPPMAGKPVQQTPPGLPPFGMQYSSTANFG